MSEDGGPAFPKSGQSSDDGREIFDGSNEGMSLRDYFAGQALAGMLAGFTKLSDDPMLAEQGIIRNQPNDMSELAYLHADAMLAAREKTG